MKQRITVTVDSDSYQLLRAYDVNISGLVSTDRKSTRLNSSHSS